MVLVHMRGEGTQQQLLCSYPTFALWGESTLCRQHTLTSNCGCQHTQSRPWLSLCGCCWLEPWLADMGQVPVRK